MKLRRPASMFLIGLVAMVTSAAAPAAERTGQSAAEKYAPFVGEYAFDLTAYGMGPLTAKVYVEGDALMIWASTSDNPDPLQPVADAPAKFTIDDPDEGLWEFEFLKNEQGKVVSLHAVNAGMGLDVTGSKVEK